MIDGNLNTNQFEEEEGGFDIKSVLVKLLINWKWIVASVIVCLCGAYIYLQRQTPVYRIQATIMINDEQKGSFQNQMQTLQQDFGIMSTTGGLDNELEVLRSKSVIKQAVIDLGLYTRYSIDNGFFKPASTLYGAYPVKVTIAKEDLDRLTSGTTFTITQPSAESCTISYSYYDNERNEAVDVREEIKLPYTLSTHIGRLVLTKGELPALAPDQEMRVSIIPPISAAKACLGALNIAPTSKTTSVAYISYLDVNKRRGVDFVNQLVVAYNRENNNDKNFVAMKTEEFIGKRLEKVATELDEAEEQMAQYKRSSGLINLSGDAQKVMQGSTEYEKQHVEIVTQLKLINYLRDYINDSNNNLQPIPVNVGLSDAGLASLIGRYKELIVERSYLLRTASESNPAVVETTTIANLMAEAIKTSIESLHNSLEIRKKDFEQQAKKYDSKLGDAPTQEKILAGYERQLEVKSGLYMMLLQKREENSIALAATADNAKLIDAALANDGPVSPNRRMIWLIALALGIAIPVAIIYLREIMRYKIEGRNDLEKLTKVPVLGDVPTSEEIIKNDKRTVVVRENSNDLMAETFRAIRTNLQFILDSPEKKIIQFTSSTAGEGKTFVSSNLATSMALLGKKVILVGLDIRKPRLAEMFNLSDRKRGITLFLSGDANDKQLLFDQIMPSGISNNLDILPAGIIPPNPAELLSRKNLDMAVEYLKEKYDYIILDTAPVGLVTDTLIVARVTDATVYICRADYTPKSNIELVNSLYKENKLKNLSIVLNGIDMTKKKYGYYYGYGKYGKYGRYGYGKYGRYGQYGYGNNA